VARAVARKGRQQPMMMPTAAGMSGLSLLRALGAAAGGRPASAGVGSGDAELLRHLEAAVTLLRQRA
jgi:hypothetical protein